MSTSTAAPVSLPVVSSASSVSPVSTDPILDALTQRAKDLSLSVVNPQTLATKLRESLKEIAGTSSVSYHIGLNFQPDGTLKAEISYLTPHLVASLAATEQSAEIGIAYTNSTESGWKIAVGLAAHDDFKAPKGAGLVASFSVTISK